MDDPDGNTYNTVLIGGSQCWMKENYEYDGDPGGAGCTGVIWVDNTDVGWCGYYNDTDYGIEGLLYQWSAIMDATPTEGNQGICPAGWHIPSDADLKALEGLLGMSVAQQDLIGWRGTNEGSKMANDVPSISWIAGSLRSDADFGTSGFDIPPSGNRVNSDGIYNARSGNALLWSSTESGGLAWIRLLWNTTTQVDRTTGNKARGFTVRCLKD